MKMQLLIVTTLLLPAMNSNCSSAENPGSIGKSRGMVQGGDTTVH